jgi:Ca2+-binding RTX toxin-like protein
VRDSRYRYIRNFTPDRPFLQANDYKQRQYPVWTLLPQLKAEGKLAPGDVPEFAGPFRSAGNGNEGNPNSGQNVENVNGGSGNDQLVGSDSGNVMNGNAGNDALTGGASTDTLSGGDGDDWLTGGLGNDAMDGGAGTNTADYSGAGSGGIGVNVNLATGQASGDGNDTLAGIQNANGSSFSDALRGTSSNR